MQYFSDVADIVCGQERRCAAPYIDAADGSSKRANEVSFVSDFCGKR
nr:hypothetical protein [Bartonella sp. AU15XJBT]